MIKIISIVTALCMSLTPSTTVIPVHMPKGVLKIECEDEAPIQGLVDNIGLQVSAALEDIENEKRVEQEVERLRSQRMTSSQAKPSSDVALALDKVGDIAKLEDDIEEKNVDTPRVEPKQPKTEKPKVKKKVTSYGYTKEEIGVLQRIVEAEATGKSIDARMNVASVIINRVNSSKFPNDIKSVVFQKGQFSPISDKRYYSVDITDKTIKAVDKVLKNGVTNNALFFCNYKNVRSSKAKAWFNSLNYLFKDDGGHSFYNYK